MIHNRHNKPVVRDIIPPMHMNPPTVSAGDCGFDTALHAKAEYSSVDDMEPGQCSSAMGAGVKFWRLFAFG
jgi:hypothetical protein